MKSTLQTKPKAEIPFLAPGFPLYREPEDVLYDKLEEILEDLEEIHKLLEKLEARGCKDSIG